jgi:hypothetical protein
MHWRITGEGKPAYWGIALEWVVRKLCKFVGLFVKDEYFDKYQDIPSPREYPPE